MSRRAIRRRDGAAEGMPWSLAQMWRAVDDDYRINVWPQIKRHAHFVGPAERRHHKDHRALRPRAKGAVRAAKAAERNRQIRLATQRRLAA